MSSPRSLENIKDDQSAWLSSALGQYLQAQEQALFDDAVANVFGFYSVQMGMLEMDLLKHSRIPYMVRSDNLRPLNEDKRCIVCCDTTQMPWQANSVDLLLLPHALEMSLNAHQTLREAERVLVPEGHLMLTCFNPYSTWGLKQRLHQDKGFPWRNEFIPLLRIKDWLALLGLEMVNIKMACFAPPINQEGWLKRFQSKDKASEHWWLMMGGVYFIVAKKKVLGMRVIRPNWTTSKIKPSMVTVPSQRQPSQQMNDSKSNE